MAALCDSSWTGESSATYFKGRGGGRPSHRGGNQVRRRRDARLTSSVTVARSEQIPGIRNGGATRIAGRRGDSIVLASMRFGAWQSFISVPSCATLRP